MDDDQTKRTTRTQARLADARSVAAELRAMGRLAQAQYVDRLCRSHVTATTTLSELWKDNDQLRREAEGLRLGLADAAMQIERMSRALEALDAEPAITVAEHVAETPSLGRYLPKSAAIVKAESP